MYLYLDIYIYISISISICISMSLSIYIYRYLYISIHHLDAPERFVGIERRVPLRYSKLPPPRGCALAGRELLLRNPQVGRPPKA